jgi:hypothetical protein
MVDDSVVFLHDTYPCNQFWTRPELSGDAFKTADIIRNVKNIIPNLKL